MVKILEYVCISETDKDVFNKKVDDLIKLNYQFWGGTNVSVVDCTVLYTQCLILVDMASVPDFNTMKQFV